MFTMVYNSGSLVVLPLNQNVGRGGFNSIIGLQVAFVSVDCVVEAVGGAGSFCP